MDKPRRVPHSYLFTVRLWREALGEGQSEWRGAVRYVTNGTERYIRDWSQLSNVLFGLLPEECRQEEEAVQREP